MKIIKTIPSLSIIFKLACYDSQAHVDNFRSIGYCLLLLLTSFLIKAQKLFLSKLSQSDVPVETMPYLPKSWIMRILSYNLVGDIHWFQFCFPSCSIFVDDSSRIKMYIVVTSIFPLFLHQLLKFPCIVRINCLSLTL